jgi:hypothetical protein
LCTKAEGANAVTVAKKRVVAASVNFIVDIVQESQKGQSLVQQTVHFVFWGNKVESTKKSAIMRWAKRSFLWSTNVCLLKIDGYGKGEREKDRR